MNTTHNESTGLMSRDYYMDAIHSHSNPNSVDADALLSDDSDSINTTLPKRSRWTNLVASKNRHYLRRKASPVSNKFAERSMKTRWKGSRRCLKVGLAILVVLGLIQLLSLIGNLVVALLPSDIHRIVESWGRPGRIGAGLASWPTDFSQDILPIPCHSHNDYWRTVPLFSAIEAGCIGVEADIWLFQEELYVGHSIPSLTPNRTLKSLYIDPLLDILSKQNPKTTIVPEHSAQLHGVFDTNPEQSLVFLIDFKTSGSNLWPYVYSALEPLRSENYLSHFNGTQMIHGPVTVVGTGNTPFDLVNSEESNPNRDIFFDAPLGEMYETLDVDHQSLQKDVKRLEAAPNSEKAERRSAIVPATKRRAEGEGQGKSGVLGDISLFNASNSYYASVSFADVFGQVWDGHFSKEQMETLQGQIRGAHRRGLKARYWDLPYWPIGLRNHVWNVLVKEGVDLLNVDDLRGATRRNWNKHRGWWRRMKGVSYNADRGR